jgi:hypothetical protein
LPNELEEDTGYFNRLADRVLEEAKAESGLEENLRDRN